MPGYRGLNQDGQGQPLQQGKVDMDVQPLGLEGGETVGHRKQLVAHRGKMVQAFLQAEIGQVVGAGLIAQIAWRTSRTA